MRSMPELREEPGKEECVCFHCGHKRERPGWARGKGAVREGSRRGCWSPWGTHGVIEHHSS